MVHDTPAYGVSVDAVVALINESVNGDAERRLAAKLILECLRRHHGKNAMRDCLHEAEHEVLLDVVATARQLASELGVID